ncbi:hypothetical protein TruAng_000274 [Truncatella angustata]|nr:hypothetical protein TruAng_000274 [Truncatella angustata]
MAPVTRSASKNHSHKSSKATSSVRKQTRAAPQSKTPKNPATRRDKHVNTAAKPPPPPKPEANARENPPGGPVLEWYSVEGSEFQDAAELLELIDILRHVRRHPGCRVILRQESKETPTPEFFVIEWHNNNGRTKFLESEESKRFMQIVEENRVRRTLLMHLPYKGGFGVFYGTFFLPYNLREVLTVYFPASLSDAVTNSLNRVKWPETWGGPMSGYTIEHPLRTPWEGLLRKEHGWADGIVEYRGQPARRMIYIFKWLDELAQQRYKQEARGADRRACDGRIISGYMDAFLDELEELGMLGYESQNVDFFEISEHYFLGDPGYIKCVNDSLDPPS